MDIKARDQRWTYWVQSSKKELEGKLGTTFSLSNGMLGIRGAHEECPGWGRPEFYVSGTYAGGPSDLLGFHDADHILSHPARIREDALKLLGDDAIWTLPNLPFPIAIRISVGGIPFSFDTHKILTAERMLEIDRATMSRTLVFRDSKGNRTRVDSVRFVSMADYNLICMQARVRRLGHKEPVELAGYLHEQVSNTNGVKLWDAGQRIEASDERGMECITRVSGISVAVAQAQRVKTEGDVSVIQLFAVAGTMPLKEALAKAGSARDAGFDECALLHEKAYGALRRNTRVEFDGAVSTVQGFNFGQMHLHMAISPIAEQTGIPIKGLTGHGYRFLTFWDMDFHMFPYYVLTMPDKARKLLEYRYSQLPKYRENAKRWGAKGAQVPWETGTRGEEETAPWLCLQDREIHISADAAYMFKRYADVTGDTSVLRDMGAEFTFETARFYASRLKWNQKKGLYDLPDIGCPDQYHTFADNNVFISLWAKWNLEYAAELFGKTEYGAIARRTGVEAEEAGKWKEMADKLYIIGPNKDGIIEEFDGFFGLEPDLNGISETYCSHSQAVKQPDVIAAFIPFEGRYPRDIRQKNWRYYNARTLHGSSLSLPGMAYGAARCGLNDEALHNLHQSCRMDLDDVNLDTERGVHVSGGAVQWCAVVHGFGGLDVTGDGIILRPNLPRQWTKLAFTLWWHFRRVDVEISGGKVNVSIDDGDGDTVPVKIGSGDWKKVASGQKLEEII